MKQTLTEADVTGLAGEGLVSSPLISRVLCHHLHRDVHITSVGASL